MNYDTDVFLIGMNCVTAIATLGIVIYACIWKSLIALSMLAAPMAPWIAMIYYRYKYDSENKKGNKS